MCPWGKMGTANQPSSNATDEPPCNVQEGLQSQSRCLHVFIHLSNTKGVLVPLQQRNSANKHKQNITKTTLHAKGSGSPARATALRLLPECLQGAQGSACRASWKSTGQYCTGIHTCTVENALTRKAGAVGLHTTLSPPHTPSGYPQLQQPSLSR